jgi:hypothetical protein
VDEIVDAGIEEGFTTSRRGWIPREEMTMKMTEEGRQTYGERMGDAPEAHSPDIWEERDRRIQQQGPDKAVGIGRRGEDMAADKLRNERIQANRTKHKIRQELKDLRRKGVWDPELEEMVGGPTGKYSPSDLDLEDRAAVVNRERSLMKRFSMVEAELQKRGPYAGGSQKELGTLANRARGAARKPTKEQIVKGQKSPYYTEGGHRRAGLKPPPTREQRLKAARPEERAKIQNQIDLEKHKAHVERTKAAQAARLKAARQMVRPPKSVGGRMTAGAGLATGGLYVAGAYMEGGAEAAAEAARTEGKVAGTMGALGKVAQKAIPKVAGAAGRVLSKVAPPLTVLSAGYELGKLGQKWAMKREALMFDPETGGVTTDREEMLKRYAEKDAERAVREAMRGVKVMKVN